MSEQNETQVRQTVVVKILSESKVVINKGANDGIKHGQSFLIYRLGDEIIDPISKSSLGCLEIVRGRGKVIYVQEKMAHIVSIETKTSRSRNSNGLLAIMNAVNEQIEDAPFDGISEGDICKPI